MQRIDVLLKIRELQVAQHEAYFNKGLFPSHRTNTVLGLTRADDNIFFSASTLYVLQSLRNQFTADEMTILKDMVRDFRPNLPDYTNKPDRNSYNFWKKAKNKHFPNGHVLHKLSKFQLPDDIDTTALVQMVSDTARQEALKTKRALPKHCNGHKVWIKNGHKMLREYRACSTWFGENMPIEFDICALSNYLLWVKKYGFELEDNDNASIAVIKLSIQQSLYFRSAFQSAPEYPKIEIILYHLARLVCATSFLADEKSKLVEDIQKQMKITTDPFSCMILQSSLLRLGVLCEAHQEKPAAYVDTYWWFTAGLLSVYSDFISERIVSHPVFHFRFVCPAFNYALLLENMLLSESVLR